MEKPRSHLTGARLKFEEGRYEDSLRQCQCFYSKSPSNVENLLLLTACHFQLNHMRESIFYGQQAMGIDPTFVEAHVAVGSALQELGKLEDATSLYNKALRVQPRFAHAYAALGCIHFQQNCLNKAIDCFEMAVSRDPSFEKYLGLTMVASGDKDGGKDRLSQSKSSAIARLSLGNVSHEEGGFDTAIGHYSHALQLEPSFIDAATNLCGSQIESFKATNDRTVLQEATSRLERIVASFTKSQSAHSKLGLCHRHGGRHKLAHQYLSRAVTLDPTNADAVCNLAALHAETGENEQSVKLCLRALQLNPNHARGFGTLGLALFQMGSVEDSLKCFCTAEKLEPDPNICSNLGSLLNEFGDTLAAARQLKKAIVLDPLNIPAFLNMGNAYFACKQYEYAEKCYQTTIDSKSEYSATALNNLALLNLSLNQVEKAADRCLHLQQKLDPNSRGSALVITDAFICQWANRSQCIEYISGGTLPHSMLDTFQPFHAQIIPQITPELALSISNAFSRRFHRRAHHRKKKSGSYEHKLRRPGDLVRVGYVSSGFGNHVNNFLFRGIFDCHNREKFQVICFALTASDGSSDWKNVQESADIFVDLRRMSCADAADVVSEHGIHILVDLDGYQQGACPEIFTLRPAPIQITMSCGTMGSESGIDYIIGDEITIPEQHRSNFSEKIIYMPNILCSGMADFNADSSKMRRKYGIEGSAFVYASFSQPYKIDPEIFAAWMEILRASPNSLLVLLRFSAAMEANLRKEVVKHEVTNDRIVFLSLVPRQEHLARCCMVDVFLDTRVCSGIATSCDALQSGAPLITVAGDRMCNRIGASLLHSLGVEEFVASNLTEYKELAVALSSDEDKFLDIIHLLDDALDSCVLFDCQLWVSAFEAALESSIEQWRQGFGPEHILLT